MRVVLAAGRDGRLLPPALPIARRLGEVCAVALAPPGPEGEAPLQAALAGGAARAIALWDDPLQATDYFGLSQALAALVRKIGFDVIVLGEGRRGLLGPALGEQLGVPHLSGIVGVEVEEDRVVARRVGWGVTRAFVVPPPAVLCVAAPASAPAIVAPDGALPIERLSLGDVGVSAAEIRWRNRFASHAASAGAVARPRVFASATELVERLVADGLLPHRREFGEAR